MNFTHLQYVLILAQEGSISRAARRLRLSQPYLSGLLGNLEKELGYRLFERGPRGIAPTPEGEQFLAGSRIILRELDRIRSLSESVQDRALTVASYYAPFVMRGFLQFRSAQKSHPSDRIKEMGNEEVIRSVQSGESGLGILFFLNSRIQDALDLIRKNGCRTYPLLPPVPLYAVMAREHPASGQTSISLKQVFSYPYVSYDDLSSKRFLDIVGVRSHPNILEVSDRGSFNDAIQSALYLSLTALTQPLQDPARVCIPLEEGLRLHSFFITARDHSLSPREKQFMAQLQNVTPAL